MIAEEKKDDNGVIDQHDHQLELRHEVKKRSSTSSALSSSSSDDSNPQVFSVDAPVMNTAITAANEPLDMQLDRPTEDALTLQQQQLLQPDSNHNPPPDLGLNDMQVQLPQANHNLAVQQLLQQQQQQQTRFTQLSLNSLQLNAPGVILPPTFTTTPTAAVAVALSPAFNAAPPPPLHSQTQEQALLALQIQQRQQVLLAQQVAAQSAAALSTRVVVPVAVTTSSHPATATLDQHRLAGTGGSISNSVGMLVPPLFGPQQQAAVASPVGLNPITTDLITAVAPLSLLASTASLATAIPATDTTLMVPVLHTPITPQMTIIPQYTPPIPPTFPPQLPTLSVRDRPLVPPIYNGINPNYPGARLLHAHPPLFAVDNFLSPAECDFLIDAACDAFGPAPVVGKGIGEVSPSRTSSTCYLAREDLPEYLRKVSLLTGKPVGHCELPQVGRYLPSQQYLQHFDAFDLSNDDGRRFAANGGQRTITVLTYLNNVSQGGSTSFPNLNLKVQPRQGMALIFFPSTLDGLLDTMALHAALPAVDVKYVSQVWIRQGNYAGSPSKRLGVRMVGGLQERREAELVARALQEQRVLMGQLEVARQLQQQQMNG